MISPFGVEHGEVTKGAWNPVSGYYTMAGPVAASNVSNVSGSRPRRGKLKQLKADVKSTAAPVKPMLNQVATYGGGYR